MHNASRMHKDLNIFLSLSKHYLARNGRAIQLRVTDLTLHYGCPDDHVLRRIERHEIEALQTPLELSAVPGIGDSCNSDKNEWPRRKKESWDITYLRKYFTFSRRKFEPVASIVGHVPKSFSSSTKLESR
jgi:hypothetical protein